MANINKNNVEKMFARLCEALGKTIGTATGDWRLDYNSTYGGFVIEEITGDGGTVSHPLGHSRRNTREFYNACHFAIMALQIKTGENL